MNEDDVPAWHPEGWHLDRDFWTTSLVLDLAETEGEWTLHVGELCDRFELLVDGPTSGFGDDSWLQLSLALEAVRRFPPVRWWPERTEP
jgi:hypothetical protein